MSSPPATASYPGNPSLPREVREKILSTFRHTLNLYHQGKSDDCVIGCDFILKMDPRFSPARKLMEKAKNPAADVDVAELEALVTATPTRQERVAAVDPERLLVRAVESYNARDFDAAIAAAEQVLAVLPGNRDALEILDKASGKKAAQPLFDASRQRALAALENNRREDARQELVRMRGLDPDHPAVALLERRIVGGSTAPPPPASPPPARPAELSDEVHFDLTSPEPHFGGLGGEMREPDIQFDGGATVSPNMVSPPQSSRTPAPPASADAGLESLSLDSLSLDPVAPPHPGRDMEATNPGSAVPTGAPAVPPGSPADLWSAPAGLDLEEPMAHPTGAIPEPPPPGGPPPPSLSLEEEEAHRNEQEIAALMRQGDEMARRGDRQQAIEIWSRIFLIDINNAEAVNRIEKTRQDMAEGNKVVSDGLKTGREKFEAGDLAGARELFLQVLAVDENDPTARFYIDKIEDELARSAAPAASPPAKSRDFEEAVPRAGSTAAAAPAPVPVPAAPRRMGLPVPPRVLGMVAIAAVAIGIGMYFVFKSPLRSTFTSRRGSPATSAAAPSLARARELSDGGQTAEARRELSRIPRSSPDYEQARRMLAELDKAPAGGPSSVAVVQTAPGPGGGPLPPPGPNDPARLRAAAEQALTEKRYIDALKNFNLAAPAFRNDPTFAQSMGVAADKVQTLAPAVKLYNEAEYEAAIPFLWRIYQDDRQNQDARSYLLRSYYNQGVTELQNGLFPKAIQSFDEGLALDPKDSEIIRHRKFAEHYLKTELDLMGRIYVRHLTHRP